LPLAPLEPPWNTVEPLFNWPCPLTVVTG
jgi:hypothetical protein